MIATLDTITLQVLILLYELGKGEHKPSILLVSAEEIGRKGVILPTPTR